MEKLVLDTIEKNKMFEGGDVVGVATSGGADSVALLHFLFTHKEELDISVIAITIDHMLRENSEGDAEFVRSFCRKLGIPCLKFSVDAMRMAEIKNTCIEEGARIARYNIFEKLLENNKVDKIALAHHESDQVETILLHILRGAGLNGAGGMDYVRGKYVRPFLDLSKMDILKYVNSFDLEYVEDETNLDSTYSRNYLRNIVMPLLKKRFDGVEKNIINFGKSCKEDNEFILSQTRHSGVVYMGNVAKIPLMYFHYSDSVINRIIFEVLSNISTTKDIERKHIELIKSLKDMENGKTISLPNGLKVKKEYDYITLILKDEEKEIIETYPFTFGKLDFAGLYEIKSRKVLDCDFSKGKYFIDYDKLPKDAVWRTRRKGDKFTKLSGGTKSLKSYLIDKKIPSRLRDRLPVLASKKEVYVCLSCDISDKVKVDENTKTKVEIMYKDE